MKGEYKGSCNITACQKLNSATWFNHFNQKYYCPDCAHRLNTDEFNKRDAQRLLGHEMCTKVEENYYPLASETSGKSEFDILINNIVEDAQRINIYSDVKTGRENRRERRKQNRKK